jgi:hypothetical protein
MHLLTNPGGLPISLGRSHILTTPLKQQADYCSTSSGRDSVADSFSVYGTPLERARTCSLISTWALGGAPCADCSGHAACWHAATRG